MPEFANRSEAMTPLEAFVSAAFAFAVTMLVISLDTIPNNFEEFMLAIKQIPSFAASFAIITWIWHTYTVWNRRYGLEDSLAVFLSCSLIFLVLIYIYPLKIMMQSLFASLSEGYFPSAMEFAAYWEIRFMFGFYATGFLLLSMNFIALYWHAKTKKQKLALNDAEIFDTNSEILQWIVTGLVCLLALVSAILLPLDYLAFSGYSYFLLFPLLTFVEVSRSRLKKKLVGSR